MRMSFLTLASRASILAGIALAALATTTELLAGPDPLPNCVYSQTCTTGGYSDPIFLTTCRIPVNAPPATAGFGTPGTKIYRASGQCGEQLDRFGFPTMYSCGDATAVRDPNC